jgi:outer membrane protein
MKKIFQNSFILTLFVIYNYSSIGQEKVWNISDCIQQAWSSNLSVKQSELNKKNAEYELEFRKAQYHPNLNASYSNGFNWGRSIDPTSYQYVNGLVNTNNLSLTGNMTLFDGFITPSRIKQSKIGLELAEGQVEQQKNWMAISIAGAYLQTLLAYENIEVVSKQLEASRELFTNTEKFYNQGLKSEGELLLVKSQIAKEMADSIQAYNTLQLAKITLSQMMEIPYSSDFNIERFNPDFGNHLVQIYFPSVETLYDSATSRLPEINNADLSIMHNELELKATKGNYYPNLSVNGSVGTNYASTSKIITQEIISQDGPIGYLYSSPSDLVYGTQVTVNPISNDYAYFDQLNDNLNSSLRLVLSIPIYNRKQVKTTAQKVNINIEKAHLELQNQKNILRKDIESDYLEYTLLLNQKKASDLKLEAYKASYQKIVTQYNLQLANSYELMLEKNKIAAVENEIIQLKYQIMFQYVILKYYQSGTVNFPDRK